MTKSAANRTLPVPRRPAPSNVRALRRRVEQNLSQMAHWPMHCDGRESQPKAPSCNLEFPAAKAEPGLQVCENDDDKQHYQAIAGVSGSTTWSAIRSRGEASRSRNTQAARGTIAAESIQARGVHGPLGGHRRLEHRDVDAGRGRRLVDDQPRSEPAQRRAGPGRRCAAHVHLRPACGSACGHR